MTTMNWIVLILLIASGLNWLLVSVFDFNLVAAIFGEMIVVARIVFALVGLAAIHALIVSPRLATSATPAHRVA